MYKLTRNALGRVLNQNTKKAKARFHGGATKALSFWFTSGYRKRYDPLPRCRDNCADTNS